MIVLSQDLCTFLHFSPTVLAELRQANLIATEDCQELEDIDEAVILQSGKSPDVVSRTYEVLRENGFDKESNFLAGKFIYSSSSGVLRCLVVRTYSGT